MKKLCLSLVLVAIAAPLLARQASADTAGRNFCEARCLFDRQSGQADCDAQHPSPTDGQAWYTCMLPVYYDYNDCMAECSQIPRDVPAWLPLLPFGL